ncbi:UDP-N-acetylmuramoyl-L-alanyl-D-glutamate--2,6-diaminopimelate ligase [Patescibacteria group bacterium]
MKSDLKKLSPSWAMSAYHWILAALATLIYWFPSEKLTVIGVTGTDGKTTTANLTAQLLIKAGYKVGLTSTTTFRIADKEWPNLTKQGMQGRFKNQQLLRRMVKAGCKYAVIETTSEGIKQYRHVGINYDVAVFTNLTEEHIEAHGSFKKYRAAKGKLFEQLARSCKIDTKKFAIINADDKHANYFLNFGCDRKIIFGIKHSRKDLPSVQAREIKLDQRGSHFWVDYDGQSSEISTPLVGEFNVYNALAAISVALSQGMSLEKIKAAFQKIKPVPGRMEIIDAGQPFTVIVDYAHAPNALENVYKTLKPFVKGKLWSLLGSQGGGRDKRKRPILGKLAGQYADCVVVTNEDPYDEKPEQIIDEVFAGVLENKTEDEDAWRILDRREAIAFILKKAQPGDIVLLTGKGSEKVIIEAGGKKKNWDEGRVVREILGKMSKSN